MDFINLFQFGSDMAIGTDFPNDLYIALAIGLGAFAIVYAFQSIALYTIGKRQGYGRLWMAFVPFFNTYYMGVASEKNKIFGKNPKYFSLGLAIFEVVMVAGWLLYYICFYVLRGTGYIIYDVSSTIAGINYYSPYFVNTDTIRSSLQWMLWVVNYMYDIMYYVGLVFVLLRVFVLISFFQTYAHGRYFIMALFSALFPIAGIIMFFVRKNNAMNYQEYVRMVQERQYRQYQQNQRYGNPYNYNPYNGNPNNYNNGNNNNYNNANQNNNAAPDPFDDFGSGSTDGGNSSDSSSGSQSTDDPFEDF